MVAIPCRFDPDYRHHQRELLSIRQKLLFSSVVYFDADTIYGRESSHAAIYLESLRVGSCMGSFGAWVDRLLFVPCQAYSHGFFGMSDTPFFASVLSFVRWNAGGWRVASAEFFRGLPLQRLGDAFRDCPLFLVSARLGAFPLERERAAVAVASGLFDCLAFAFSCFFRCSEFAHDPLAV